jgi:hypothetical protein
VVSHWLDHKGDAAIAPLLSAQRADFNYAPDAMLTEMPNVDQALDVVIHRW